MPGITEPGLDVPLGESGGNADDLNGGPGCLVGKGDLEFGRQHTQHCPDSVKSNVTYRESLGDPKRLKDVCRTPVS